MEEEWAGDLVLEEAVEGAWAISKEQGNLEGLIDVRDKNIFFLLMVKCKVIAEMIGVIEKNVVALSNQKILQTETNYHTAKS